MNTLSLVRIACIIATTLVAGCGGELTEETTESGGDPDTSTAASSTSGSGTGGAGGATSTSSSSNAATSGSGMGGASPTVVATLNFDGNTGYMLSNQACGGDCNLGSTDQEQATYTCVLAGYTTALTYHVQTDTFYPCWCIFNTNQVQNWCCADNPGIPTSQMITSITCQ